MLKKETKILLSVLGLGALNALVFYSSFLSVFSLLIPLAVFFKLGRKNHFINLLVSSSLIWALAGNKALLIFVALIVFSSLLVTEFYSYLKNIKKTYFYTLVVTLGSYLLVTTTFLMSKNLTYVDYISTKVNLLITFLETQSPELFTQMTSEYGVDKTFVINQILLNLPGFFIIAYSLFVLFNIVLAARYSASIGKELSILSVKAYKVNVNLVWPALAAGAMYLYANSEFISPIYFKISAISFFDIFLLIYFFQGTSVLLFLLNRFLGRFIFVQIFIVFTLVTSMFSFLSLLGFFDIFFDIRSKLKKGVAK